MKKTNLFKTVLLLCALIVGSVNGWAADVTISVGSSYLTWTADGNDYKATSGDFNLRYEKGDYNNSIGGGIQSNELRLYSGTNFVISSSYTITQIVYTVADGSGKNYSVAALSTEDGNLTDGTWTGSATSVSASLSAQNRIKSVTITYSTGGGSTPAAVLSKSSLDFGNVNIGETKDMTFTITPANLTADLTISCNNDKYEVDTELISKDETTAQTITVTAKPTVEGEDMDGTITISGGGLAADKTVTLTATAYDPANANVFVKVTNASTLRAGDQLIIVAQTNTVKKVMGAINGSYFNAVDVTIESDGTIVDPSSANILTLDGEEGAWYLKQNSDNKYILSSSTSASTGAKADAGEVTIEVSEGNAIITFPGGQWYYNASSPRFRVYTSNQTAVQLYRLSKSVTITDAEYATYSGSKNLNFSGVDIQAFIAKDNGSTISLTEITNGEVPAGTPVILYKEGADGTAINVPVIASTTTVIDDDDNDLEVSDGTTAVGDDIYVLAMNPTIGFYRWTSASSLSEGKVYLKASAALGREFIGFDGETTGIKQVEGLGLKVEGYYNLNGQRVAQPTKGLYIVNGKKVVIK